MDPYAYSDSDLASILERSRVIAVVGASPSADRPSYEVMLYLLEKGYRVIPVNPAAAGTRILGQRVYRALAEIPASFDMVDVFRRPALAGAVVDDAIVLKETRGIRTVWMQLAVRDDAAAARAARSGLAVVMDRCPKIEIGRLGLRADVNRRLHPGYPIDWIGAGNGGGVAGMGFCPGNHYLQGRERDLEADLAAICGFGSRALVSLMEDWELTNVGVDPNLLRETAVAYGMEWHHLPISDMGVPDQAFESAWAHTGRQLHELLEAGETVFFHCLAGLGRTGTVVARMLVERGENPDAAIARVRRARPGTIQTAEQEAHVRKWGQV